MHEEWTDGVRAGHRVRRFEDGCLGGVHQGRSFLVGSIDLQDGELRRVGDRDHSFSSVAVAQEAVEAEHRSVHGRFPHAFGAEYALVTESQDIDYVLSDLDIDNHTESPYYATYTALHVLDSDGDRVEVWGTESSRPYSNEARYTRLK